MEPTDRPRSAFRRWVREVKADIKDSFKKLIRSVSTSRSSTPGPRARHRTQALAGQDTTVMEGAQVLLGSGPGLLRTRSNPELQAAQALEPLSSTAPLSASSVHLPGDPQPPIATDSGFNNPNAQSSSIPTNDGVGAAAQTQVQMSVSVSGGLSTLVGPSEDVLAGQASTLLSIPPAGSAAAPSGKGADKSGDVSVDAEQSAPPIPAKGPSTFKDTVKLSGRFTQMLLKRLPEIVDTNPIKVALGVAKAITQIKEAVESNMDDVDRRIASTGEMLKIVGDGRIRGWGPNDPESAALARFESTLSMELAELHRLSSELMARKIVDHEDEKSKIATIFERINGARMQFELYTNIRIAGVATKLEQTFMWALSNNLHPSHIADHKYHLEGKQQEALRREVCTPGTRVSVIEDAVKWANDTSPESEDIFYLFGPAGSGKTTIAHTVA